jgi:hypothetical protein
MSNQLTLELKHEQIVELGGSAIMIVDLTCAKVQLPFSKLLLEHTPLLGLPNPSNLYRSLFSA